VLGNRLPRWQLALVAAACTFLAEWLGPGHWRPHPGDPRGIFIFTAYFGLFADESGRNRQLTLRHVREMEKEIGLRRDAEQQPQILIESSPAAILMTDAAGKILMAQASDPRVAGIRAGDPAGLVDQDVSAAFGPRPPQRTVRAQLPNGVTMLRPATGWRDRSRRRLFSSYQTRSGAGLATMLLDVSQDLRDGEEFGLHQLMAGSSWWWAPSPRKSATDAALSQWSRPISPATLRSQISWKDPGRWPRWYGGRAGCGPAYRGESSWAIGRVAHYHRGPVA